MSEPKKPRSNRGKPRAKTPAPRRREEPEVEEKVEASDPGRDMNEDNRETNVNRSTRNEPKPNLARHSDDEDRDYDSDYDDDRRYEDEDDRPAPPPPRKEEMREPLGPADEYQFQVTFDRQTRRYLGTVVEFPELRASAYHPDQALDEIRLAVEDHLELTRRRNEPVAEPMGTKTYPSSLSVNVSQGLFRKLDLLSRQEKVAIDQLVSELLAGAVERRFEPAGRPSSGGQRQPQHNSSGNHGNHSRNDGNRRHNNHQGGGGGGRHRGGRNSEMMENRESFMEYVRNLEKGGGGWKKR